MNMLTGNFLPSSGDAWLYGLDIKTQQLEVRAKLGYCPQHDALLDLLTVREHLQLFGRIKGVAEKDLSRYVETVIKDMDLTEFANKLAGRLSGGNKRKLSVGIATIGRPPIVFLDEPSTGMDPVARRFMWDVIERISQQDSQCAVVLTTHSMEECEALCGRVGIMVGGRLRCLGSAQHLKGRYGQGYQLEVKLIAEDSEHIEKLVQSSGLEMSITAQTAGQACAALGDASLAAHITAEDPVGHNLYNSFLPSGPGFVSSIQFLSWYKAQERASALIASITQNWSDACLVERHDRNLRFQLGSTDGVQLATVFTFVEEHRERLGIDDYAVSQTSLEQIFNGFARQQEEETSAVRGIMPQNEACGPGSVLATPVPRAAP
jgi:ATP-binding cassette subfamily A (ABC1) protein 1